MTALHSHIDRAFARLNDPSVRRVVLIAACIALAAGLAWALVSDPSLIARADWRPLALLIATCIPAGLALNAMEFVLTARLLGRRIAYLDALEVAVVGAAANMLPLPGSTVVRIAQLKAAGATLGSGARATLAVALLWFGVAGCYAAAWLGAVGDAVSAVAFAVPSAALLAVSMWLMARAGWPARPAVWLVANKIALVTVHAARMYLCLYALGVAASFAQASGLMVTGVLGSAVSVVPAGLGIREAAAAALAPLLGLSAAAAFVATALNRMLGLGVLVPLAAALARLRVAAEREAA